MDLHDLQDEIKKLERKRELLTESLRRIRKHLILMPMGDSRRDVLEFEQGEQETELNGVKEEIASYQGLMLYKSLMSLNYIDHTSLFMNVSRTYRIGAFLLHGSAHTYHDYQGYSVRTLLKRLVYTVPNSAATPLMHLDLSSPIQSSDIAALWRYLAVKVNLGTDAQHTDIIKRVCTKLQTQNVILILRGIDYVSEEHLHKIIHEFWEPLAIVAHQTQRPTNRYLLLMFLVDYRGGVKDWKISCAERPDESWKPYIPIRLPSVTKFSDRDLSKWIDHWSETLYDILPDNLRQGPLEARVQSILEKSDDGIPDLVMSHICSQCGFYLEGAEECLRL